VFALSISGHQVLEEHNGMSAIQHLFACLFCSNLLFCNPALIYCISSAPFSAVLQTGHEPQYPIPYTPGPYTPVPLLEGAIPLGQIYLLQSSLVSQDELDCRRQELEVQDAVSAFEQYRVYA
jgi:hypothetical protein